MTVYSTIALLDSEREREREKIDLRALVDTLISMLKCNKMKYIPSIYLALVSQKHVSYIIYHT